jgi:hypothetical protein
VASFPAVVLVVVELLLLEMSSFSCHAPMASLQLTSEAHQKAVSIFPPVVFRILLFPGSEGLVLF